MGKDKCCSDLGSEHKACCGSDNRTLEKSCCSEQQTEKKVLIEFMYIDLTTCDRCLGTDSSLDEAIAEASMFLQNAGYAIEVRKILVETEKQAEELEFVSSPTIRINGRDIQLDSKESKCGCCGEIAGQDIDCRVWVWQGKEYTTPPKALIIDAILRSIYGAKRPPASRSRSREVPDNLKRFFAAVANKK